MKILDEQGFFILEKALCPSAVIALRQKIKAQLVINAQEIRVPLSDYLYCTGRWASPSKMTQCVEKESNFILKQKLQSLLGKQIALEKCNIICKNQHIKETVPLHQDISYSPDSPYHYSLWLALNDVDEHAGALQFIVGSHQWPISPAVDFWSPLVNLDKPFKQKYHTQLQKIHLKKGDAVLFDSRLWHGSTKNISGNDRYAYVTRWIIQDRSFPDIPPIQPASFGMWNCHAITQTLLKESLPYYSIPSDEMIDFIELIVMWKKCIKNLPSHFQVNKDKAIRDLHHVQILHQAANKHHAGDLTGRIYRHLWHSLLAPLQSNFR
jgi:ectoine hydroxylase-related dioxygenase (phytanoyl-CoA dioxygenase family)